MLQLSAHPGQEFDHGRITALLDRVHWDDLNTLHSVSLHSSFRKASKELRISANTVRSRIARLEQSVGTLMFRRGREGLNLTAEGAAVLSVARDMRLHSTGLTFGEGNRALVKDGEIRIFASEGLGTFWLTPRLKDLRQRVDGLTVLLDSSSDQQRLTLANHDVAVGFVQPEDPDAIVSRLGFVHMIPFASEDYLRRHGHPHSMDDVAGHECILQDAPGLNYEALRLFLGEDAMARLVSIRVSSSYSLFWAVASGNGIGALPTYIRSVSRKVIPVDLPIQLKFEIWMSYSRIARHSVPVRQTVEWLRSCFDPGLYPWFGERFVHPSSFSESFADSQVVPIFDHLIDETG